jgi:ABC-2 type transport system ATP-binding protein
MNVGPVQLVESAEPYGITAAGVRRRFGPVEALRGLDLTVPYGEVTALVGPNGAGKTTLLLVLATLLVPDGGDVRVAGCDPVTDPAGVRAATGWTPDVFGVYDALTAGEYLGFFAEAYRMPKAQARSRVAELLSLVHLAEYADRPVHVLSRGQKQRLGLARALVHGPRVLLLDEPASGLDPRSRIELRDLLRSLAAQGVAVLVSSHILAELEEVADRVVFVDKGATVGEHRITELAARRRTWRLRALDQAALTAALGRAGQPHGPPAPGGVDVELVSDEAAAELLALLVRDRVPVVSCTPTGGELESAYLSLTEERR